MEFPETNNKIYGIMIISAAEVKNTGKSLPSVSSRFRAHFLKNIAEARAINSPEHR